MSDYEEQGVRVVAKARDGQKLGPNDVKVYVDGKEQKKVRLVSFYAGPMGKQNAVTCTVELFADSIEIDADGWVKTDDPPQAEQPEEPPTISESKRTPRDLHVVLGQMIEKIPPTESEFLARLTDHLESVNMAPPEGMRMWWGEVSDSLEEFIGVPDPKEQWQKDIVAIFMGTT